MSLFVTGRQPPTLPGKPASQRGNPYPLICPSPWSRLRGDKAIIGTEIAFAGRKLPNLFVGHLTNSLHLVGAYPPARRQSTAGTIQAQECVNDFSRTIGKNVTTILSQIVEILSRMVYKVNSGVLPIITVTLLPRQFENGTPQSI